LWTSFASVSQAVCLAACDCLGPSSSCCGFARLLIGAVVCVCAALQFDYGHMDFTFSAKEELGWYVMSLLMRT
jgi:hypothetical protein